MGARQSRVVLVVSKPGPVLAPEWDGVLGKCLQKETWAETEVAGGVGVVTLGRRTSKLLDSPLYISCPEWPFRWTGSFRRESIKHPEGRLCE